jgi:uncharacterized protein (TIGR04168 family)
MKIAIIGDVHGFWDERDTAYFNQSDYDFILFTGDLRSYTESEASVANRISPITKKSFLIPGNTDTSNLFQAAGEVFRNNFLIKGFSLNQNKKMDRMKKSLGNIQLSAYESHLLSKEKISVNLIVLRPFAMGVNLSYAPILKKRFGIESLQGSKEKYRQLIEESSEDPIIFLGHNGPFGLGSEATSLWSSDFTKEPLDWGDTDYRFAIDYAKSKGKKVLAAIAGHMHHKIKGKKTEREWHSSILNTSYINAAKVPRIFKRNEKTMHYHVELVIKEEMQTTVREVFVE